MKSLYSTYDETLQDAGDVNIESLDPTQLLAYTLVAEWSQERAQWLGHQSLTVAPELRMMLLGTAGTGKTHTAKLAIQKARQTFGSFHSVLTVAFSGVAAANLGDGARTVDSIFHTNTDTATEDLTGEALDKAVELLKHVQFIVIDEISTLGAAQFEIICRRLEQVGKVVWRTRRGSSSPDSLGGLGGIGVLLLGDFAQLPPVMASSLLAQAGVLEGRSAGLRSLALAGRQTFQDFTQVVRLRRVHRLPGADLYKDSTLRLRDAAISMEDYALWKTHELDTLDAASNPSPWTGAEGLLDSALVLVTDNAQAGRVNGRRLSTGVPLLTELRASAPGSASAAQARVPSFASVEQVIVRCCARHNHEKARHLDAREFRNLRTATHLRVAAKVILITNRLWSTDTVPLGLMNGARGVVVAILFAPPGTERRDGLELAGVGFPHSDGVSLPRSLDQCPLPDLVIVHFAGYKGPALMPGLPATWVPVPCIQQQSKRKRSLVRVGVPLKLAWALTIHKAQGITEPNGVIVSFQGSRMIRAVSRMGLAFVAWTRTTSWERMAFLSLPPLEDFLAVRFSKEFRARESFEAWADGRHDSLLAARGLDEGQHIQQHQQHLRGFLRQKHQREATERELRDLEQMLRARGVASVSESVLRAGAGKQGRGGRAGLWSIVASFRAEKQATVRKKTTTTEGRAGGRQKPALSPTDVVLIVLREHGYEKDVIQQALETCGPDLQRCIDYCLVPAESGHASEHAIATEENWAAHVIQGLGYDETTTTEALELCEFSFSAAVRLLLLGNDQAKAAQLGVNHFRRHTTNRVYGIPEQTLSSDPVRAAYEDRARQDLDMRVRAVDLGQYAGGTTAACFWLSLAAGLAHTRWEVPGQALPALPEMAALLATIRETPLSDLDHRTTTVSPRTSPVGQAAFLLRRYMCHGPDAVLLRADMLNMLFPAFAALDSQSDRRQLQQYKAWVKKLASKEYADELVLLATAHTLQVEIVCVPFTPEAANAPWAISTYRPQGGQLLVHRRIMLGNNDVHYMWLAITDSKETNTEKNTHPMQL